MKKLFLLLIPAALIASPQGVPTMSVATVGTSSTLALAANPYRGYLIMQNQGTTPCVISPVGSVTSPDGIMILAGQNYEVQQGFIKTAIHAVCGSSGTRIVFLETNF